MRAVQALWIECGMDPERLMAMPVSRLIFLYSIAADWLAYKNRDR